MRMTANVRSAVAGCFVLLSASSRIAQGFVSNSAHAGRGLFGVVVPPTRASSSQTITDRRHRKLVPGVVNFYGDLVRYVSKGTPRRDESLLEVV
jgi:hypothetical protein